MQKPVKNFEASYPDEVDTDLLLHELLSRGLVDEADGVRAKTASKRTGLTFIRTLLELAVVEEAALFDFLSEFLGTPLFKATDFKEDFPERLNLPVGFLRRVKAVPIIQDGFTWLAQANPEDAQVIDLVRFHVEQPVRQALMSPSAVTEALECMSLSGSVASTDALQSDIDRLEALANQGPTIEFVNRLINQSLQTQASDIHIEASSSGAVCRFRVDGQLFEHQKLTDTLATAAVSRLKVMCSLNISEKRRPQDGRTQVIFQGRSIDLRASFIPTEHGESAVLRVLDRDRVALRWDALGFSDEIVAKIAKAVEHPNGIFLVSGPTGSGKTTTLYTILSGMNDGRRKLVSVEDPVEYSLAGVNQTQVQADIGMDFATALRAILRQDPDVILIGEIRDEETAEIAIRAALVGRMVLATVHANDARSVVERMLNLGVPEHLLRTTLRGVLSQRLQPQTCSECAGEGCSSCNGSGFGKRKLDAELLIEANLWRS